MTAVLVVGILLLVVVGFLVRDNRQLLRKYRELSVYAASRPYTEADLATARKASVGQSRSTLNGHIQEQLAPLLPVFAGLFNFKDAQFVGGTVDYLVFDGLDEERPDVQVVFLEIKTGQSKLNRRQQLVRDAVLAKRVEWKELRFDGVSDLVE
jgi:predicted Holliday junction resolvase-like endonuclease